MTKNKIKFIAIRVDQKLYEQIAEAAEQQDRSVSSMCRYLMQQQLKAEKQISNDIVAGKQ